MQKLHQKNERTRKSESWILIFLYKTMVGRGILKIITKPIFSKLIGYYMDTSVSKIHINTLVRKAGIDLEDYEEKDYKSFNDFFTRKVKKEKRPISFEEDILISPCDGKLTVYPINRDSVFKVKNSRYSVRDFIPNSKEAPIYEGGLCCIFRLCVDNYHRYHYIDNGKILERRKVPGILHTVRPIAVKSYPVYIQNSREYTVMKTENFGKVTQVEVGAICIGRILNRKGRFVKKGTEKGMFLYGGSTIVLLIEPKKVHLNKEILECSRKDEEINVKMGQAIGRKILKKY